MRVDHVVQIPTPGRLAPRALALRPVVTRVTGVRRVHRHRPRRLALRPDLARRTICRRKLVETEVVHRPEGVRHLQVRTVPRPVVRTGQELDLRPVIVLQPPGALRLLIGRGTTNARGIVRYQLTRMPTQRQRQVRPSPALVRRTRDPCLVAHPVRTLDETRAQVPAVTDPRRLRVRGRRFAVHRRRVVSEGQRGRRPAERGRHHDRVAVRERPRRASGRPLLTGSQRRGAVGARPARRRGVQRQQHLPRRGERLRRDGGLRPCALRLATRGR
ncbi:hypothetical protein KAURM247S_05232 [Kitasatospora aureofaciens]